MDLYVLDAVLAVVVGGMLCAYAALESPLHGGVREPVWVSVLVGLAIGLPLALRRRWPTTVAIVISCITSATLVTGVIPNFAAAAPAFAIGLSFTRWPCRRPRVGRWSAPPVVSRWSASGWC
ncbi:hypothetical protein GCM10027614_62370 [Micromonospora vulcania]